MLGHVPSALQMTTSVDGKQVPTVAGVLLAGKHDVIKRMVPAFSATFQVLEGMEVRVNQDFDQPLLYTIEKMYEMFEPWNPEREVEDGLLGFRFPSLMAGHFVKPWSMPLGIGTTPLSERSGCS